MGKKSGILFSTAAVAVAAIAAVGANRYAPSTLSCRARLYLQKAEGGVSELSWIELWAMTGPGRGFDCTAGDTLEARIQFSQHASEDDRQAGARIFGEQCAKCHGSDGSGGFGPSLTRSEYNHGDTDLAIYLVLRNGVPGTAMPRADLPPVALLEVLSHLRALQARASENRKSDTSRLAIQVSSERLKAAGTKPDEWLMYSGSYNGWRHTSLAEITPANVAQLRVRWVKQFDMKGREQRIHAAGDRRNDIHSSGRRACGCFGCENRPCDLGIQKASAGRLCRAGRLRPGEPRTSRLR